SSLGISWLSRPSRPAPGPSRSMLCAGSRWRPQRPSTASGLRPPTLPALWESGRDRLSGAALASGWEQTAGSGAGDPALRGGERDAADVGHRRRGVRVALAGEPAVLERDQLVEVRGLLRIAQRLEQVALGHLAA